MSENKEELLLKLFGPVADSAGSTLQDAWELVFGGFGNYVEKKRLTRAQALEDFKFSLESKVTAIPVAQLCEPPLSVVGPALEAAKYYFEEPDIREMFAKLIASSMDSTTAKSVHPSFCEIIKQMSPLDAQNLALFKLKSSLPIAEFQLKTNEGFGSILRPAFLSNPAQPDLYIQAESISSLERLGLLETEYGYELLDCNDYNEFPNTQLFRSFQSENPDYELVIAHGLVRLTPLGEKFRSICLD